MEIKDYQLSDFIRKDPQLIEDYMIFLNELKGKPNFIFGKMRKQKYGVDKSLTELKYGEVIKLKRLVTKTDAQSVFESIATAYHFPIEKVPQLPISTFYSCLNFIVKEITHIIKVENDRFKVEPSPYDDIIQQAGINELEKLGELPIIDQLANGNVWDYDKVEEQPYMAIHAKIWLETIKTNINIRKENLMNLPK